MKHAYCLDCDYTYQDDGKTPRRCPKCDGARVVVQSNNELVRGVISWPVDDQAREDAIADLRVGKIAPAVDDYVFAVMQAGSLGGVQLD